MSIQAINNNYTKNQILTGSGVSVSTVGFSFAGVTSITSPSLNTHYDINNGGVINMTSSHTPNLTIMTTLPGGTVDIYLPNITTVPLGTQYTINILNLDVVSVVYVRAFDGTILATLGLSVFITYSYQGIFTSTDTVLHGTALAYWNASWSNNEFNALFQALTRDYVKLFTIR
jgi:hypothetical protein